MKALTYVEIDVDYCANTYGIAPCTAALGVTGDIKCFNTQRTCQDLPNFINEPVTLRFAPNVDYLPRTIPAIPNVLSVQQIPGEISLGESLGLRSTVTVTFRDHPHSDTGPGMDKYRTERGYNAFKRGTFWGRFRARYPYLLGRRLRIRRGFLGQSLDEMATYHYVIESFEGPDFNGNYTIIGKDILKLADNDRAQAPRLTDGRLIASINSSASSATLTPAGIGDAQYPSSGWVAIGGEEICAFTRSGDTLTLTRGQLGTTATSHDAEDRVQLVLRYEAMTPAEIIADLLINYAGVPPEFIPINEWEEEVTNFLGRLYTRTIAEPTGVNKLVSELVQQAALAVWWDDVTQLVRLRVLRGIGVDVMQFSPDNILKGTLKAKDQPDKRLSQVWTYYGQRNPLRGDQADNFRSALATIDTEAQGLYGQPSIRKIFGNWIPPFGSQVAERVNEILIARFRDPPRRFTFEVMRRSDIEAVRLGEGYRLIAYAFQDETGEQITVPIQVTRVEPLADRYRVEAEEMLITDTGPVDLTNRIILIDSNVYNFRLWQVHNSIYPQVTPEDVSNGVNLTVIIGQNVRIGSTSISTPAFHVGTTGVHWPSGFPIYIENRGRIQGRGGNGGVPFGAAAQAGGTALYTRHAIQLKNENGQIWGGGGGGGWTIYEKSAWTGGGGAGNLPGSGNPPGTQTAGGNSIWAGRGGNPGQAGGSRPGTVGWSGGGAAGRAIDGVSHVTNDGSSGDRRGPQVN